MEMRLLCGIDQSGTDAQEHLENASIHEFIALFDAYTHAHVI